MLIELIFCVFQVSGKTSARIYVYGATLQTYPISKIDIDNASN